jgi:hypothetical protein
LFVYSTIYFLTLLIHLIESNLTVFFSLLKKKNFSNAIPLFFKRYRFFPMRYHFFQTIPLFSIPPIPLYISHQKFQNSNKLVFSNGIFGIQRKSFCLNFSVFHWKKAVCLNFEIFDEKCKVVSAVSKKVVSFEKSGIALGKKWYRLKKSGIALEKKFFSYFYR